MSMEEGLQLPDKGIIHCEKDCPNRMDRVRDMCGFSDLTRDTHRPPAGDGRPVDTTEPCKPNTSDA